MVRSGRLILVGGSGRLGSGAFAEVKKAAEIATGRQVAIKVSPVIIPPHPRGVVLMIIFLASDSSFGSASRNTNSRRIRKRCNCSSGRFRSCRVYST